MGMRISTNVAALASRRALAGTSTEQQKTYQRLSSGNRITSAGDDAAGLSISENLKSQLRSMKQAERNANDGISFIQVAEGGIGEISNILVRMRELSIQAASDTVGDKERGFINEEVQQLVKEVDRIANVTTFNGTNLLNGEAEKAQLEFQVGIRNAEADRIQFDTTENNVKASELGIDGIETTSIDNARDMMDKVDEALNRVSASRARLGASQNKMQSTVNNLGVAKENLATARSRIADVDVAEETSEMVRQNILQSAGVSVLAQANSVPMQALKLIG